MGIGVTVLKVILHFAQVSNIKIRNKFKIHTNQVELKQIPFQKNRLAKFKKGDQPTTVNNDSLYLLVLCKRKYQITVV